MNLIIGSSQHRCGTLSKQSFLPPPNHVMFLPLHYADMSTHKSGQLILNIFFWAGLVLITSSSLIQYATGQIIHKKKYIEKASSDSILITVGWIANHIPKDLHYHNWGDSKPQKAGEILLNTEENKHTWAPYITSLPSIPLIFAVKNSRINTKKLYKQCILENYWDEWITDII